MEEENRNEDSGGRIPILQLDSMWAWFYYLIFGVQLLVVSYYHAERELRTVTSDSPIETYVAILKSVSSQVPAIAAYSLIIVVTGEGLRMIAERYLARRFAEGKKRGIEEGRAEGIEEGRAEGIEEGKKRGVEEGRAEGIEEGRAEGIEEGVKQASVEYDERLARWLDANPAVKDAIESGEVNPPPFLNGDHPD